MKKKYLVLALLGLLVWGGCAKKSTVAKIADWQQFQDPYFKVTFSYPKGWHVVTEPNRVTIYSTQESMGKFFDPTSKNPEGVQIMVAAEKDSLRDLGKYVEGFKSEKMAAGYEIKSLEPKSLEATPGTQVTFSGQFEGGARLGSIRTITAKDSMIYYVHYGAFGDYFDSYKLVYDSVLASLTLPKPRVIAKNVDPSLPVPEMAKFQNDRLEITYPENFNPSIKKTSGEVEFAMELKAYRQDATINIDIRPAKKNSLEKIVDQNSKNFKGVSGKSTSFINNERTVSMNYQPLKGVDGRVYFIVKNDKFYRIIVFYPSALKKDFLPAFEKTVASLRIK